MIKMETFYFISILDYDKFQISSEETNKSEWMLIVLVF